MTEALIAELAQLKGVRVISRTSSMRYRGSRQALPEIARELGVTHIIEGSVARDKARVRVTAQLIEAASDRHIWAESYDRQDRDVLGIQAEVATAIAREVGGTVVAVETLDRRQVDPPRLMAGAATNSTARQGSRHRALRGRQRNRRRTGVRRSGGTTR
jgi:hypothetical protein